MRPGGSINLATRRGQFPHVRHCALIALSRTQSVSANSPEACLARMASSAASIVVSQSPASDRTMVEASVTLAISPPSHEAPQRLPATVKISKRTNSNAFFVAWRKSHGDERAPFHQPVKFIQNSPVALISPPVCATGEVGAAGFQPGRSRETCELEGCRPRPRLGMAPELRRRLRPLKPGRRAPAGSRDAVFDRRQDLRVRVPVHVRSPFRQVHQ